MESPEILIINDQSSSRTSWDAFLKSPQNLFEEESSHIWFATESTLSMIASCQNRMDSQTSVLQCASPGVLEEILSHAPLSVRASLGLTGLTAISTQLLRSIFENGSPKNGVELLLVAAVKAETWKIVSHKGSSFPLRSPIPASSATHDHSLLTTLRSLKISQLADNPLAQTEIMAGILLIHDFLEPSHEYSQSIEGSGPDVNGDYWHGIMHRREPDFGNSKYWFRRVGDHPCFPRLAQDVYELAKKYNDAELNSVVQTLTESGWDSFAAVDFFQEAHQPARKGSVWHQFAEEIQGHEMLLLLQHCLL